MVEDILCGGGENMKIDFVIAWVDGSDPAWQAERRKYKPDAGSDGSAVRYRDMGIMKYWFRAVEAYAPWVNRIHFITWGHLPDWLNTDHPKLHIVNHRDYIPEEYLPTFSSRPIELNMHRIPDLSEHFVYFNDDILLNGPVTPDFFFHKGLPCDYAHIENIGSGGIDDVYSHTLFNESYLVSKHHSYLRSFLKHPSKYINFAYPCKSNIKNLLKIENKDYFPSFDDHHLATAYLKQSFVDLWDQEFEILDQVSRRKFRSPFGISQRAVRFSQLASGRFHPVAKKSRGKLLHLWMEPKAIYDAILCDNNKMICMNDTTKNIDFSELTDMICRAYEQKFPKPSAFEK